VEIEVAARTIRAVQLEKKSTTASNARQQ